MDNQRDNLLRSALACCEQGHILTVRREDIAVQAGVQPSLVNYYFGTMASARQEIVEYAVSKKHLRVMQQALTLPEGYLSGPTWARLKNKAKEITGA